MPLNIVRQDITKMGTDAVVNAANTALLQGGGVCGAIFGAAGAKELQKACDKLSPISTGEAVITPGFALPAKYIIHAAGPVYNETDKAQSRRLLYSAYENSLKLAKKNGCESIAFPLISSGIYGYPKGEALIVAREAITDFLSGEDMDVYLAVFDRSALKVSRELFDAVESYIDENYAETHETHNRPLLYTEKKALNKLQGFSSIAYENARPMHPATGIDDLMNNLGEPFSDSLLKLIDNKGKTDVEVYKKANIDRKLFSKIRTGKGYTPKKPTILALAIALELTPDETEKLLKTAGYALSHSNKFDVIVEYFINSGRYNIFEINEVLFKYDLPTLGS